MNDTAGIGHNILGIDDDTFLRHARTIGSIEGEMAIVRKRLNKARKAARADGIKLKLFDAMRQVADLPRAEQQEHLAHQQAYLRWLRSPIGTQFSLSLDDDPTLDVGEDADDRVASQVVEDARGAGYRAALAGEWQDANPHDENSESGQAWIAGFHEGQSVQAHAMGEDSDENSGT